MIETQTFIIKSLFISQLVILHVSQIMPQGKTVFVFLTLEMMIVGFFFLTVLNIMS